MQFFNINRVLLGIIAVIVIAAAIFMIVVPLLDQPAVADESAAAPTIVPQQPSLGDAVQDFADRLALDRRLRTLEQQIQTLSNTAPRIVPQQPPIADPPQDFADRIALDQRLQWLERQIQTLLDMQIQILLNTRERAAQTPTKTFPKSWVLNQTTTKYHHRLRHEIDGTALAGETVDANPARRGITNASGCPASVPCVERGTAPFRGRLTICSKLHAKRDQCIVARVRRFGAKVAASFVSHAIAPGVRCHAGSHSMT